MLVDDLEYVQNRMRTNQFVGAAIVSRAINHEIKAKKSFSNAKKVFEYLKEVLDGKKRRNEEYGDSDIIAFRRAMTNLVRYAPTTKDSRYYLSEFYVHLHWNYF